MKLKKVNINGNILEVLTIGQLGTLCGRTIDGMRKLEQRGVLPSPHIRGKRMANGVVGKRYYSKQLSEDIKKVLLTVTRGIEVTGEQKRLLAIAFQQELERIQPKPLAA